MLINPDIRLTINNGYTSKVITKKDKQKIKPIKQISESNKKGGINCYA